MENWTEYGKTMILMEYCDYGDLNQYIQRHKLGCYFSKTIPDLFFTHVYQN